MIVIPTDGVEDWQARLADPEKHWRGLFSALTRHATEASPGLPPEVTALFDSKEAFAGIELLLGIPEHKVPLPGGSRPSQTDLWVLARTAGDLVSIAVEGKVRESFGPTLDEWFGEDTTGKRTRWTALCDLLSLAPDCDRTLRYQLVHRTASAVIEAKRFHARKAALIVHSFSTQQDGFSDFQAFGASWVQPLTPRES
jgi:hypothetical protein